MENSDFNGGINKKDIFLELLEFSVLPLHCMTEDIHGDIEKYREAVKNNGMSIAWDVFDVCDKELILEAIKHPKGFKLFAAAEKRKKLLHENFNYILKTFSIPNMSVIILERK